jgi:hypothetical protein
MPKEDPVLVQLATRVPRSLHRELKTYCVASEQSLMLFTTEALQEKLDRERRRGRRRS